MRASLRSVGLVGGLGWAALAGGWAFAQPPLSSETPAVSVSSAVSPKAASPAGRRAAWEAILQSPANLEFEEETVTLRQVLDRVRSQHKLPVTLDYDRVLPLAAGFHLVSTEEESTSPATAPSPTYPSPPASALDPASPGKPIGNPTGIPVPTAPTDVPPVLPGSPPAPLPSVSPEGPSPYAPPVVAPAVSVPTIMPPPLTGPVVAPMPVVVPPSATVSPPSTERPDGDSASVLMRRLEEKLGSFEIDAAPLEEGTLTVEDVLRRAVRAALPVNGVGQLMMGELVGGDGGLPLPISLTEAFDWEVIVTASGVSVTTSMHANLQKEVRVYRVKHLEEKGGWTGADLKRVVLRTVRPWSWKPAQEERPVGEAVAGKGGLREAIASKVAARIADELGPKLTQQYLAGPGATALVAGEEKAGDGSIQITDSINVKPSALDLELLQAAATQLLTTSISAIQNLYHAEPPTGVIEALPGVLVVTQSRAAHREIADLLDGLAAAVGP